MNKQLTKLAAIGAMAVSMAFAQTTPTTNAPAHTGKAGPFRARVQRRMVKALNLTDAQKQQAKTIMQSTRQQAQPVRQQLKQERQALNAAVQAGDSAKIQQISGQVGTLNGQMLAIRANGRAQFFAMLTPDQKAKAAEFRQKVKQVMGGRQG